MSSIKHKTLVVKRRRRLNTQWLFPVIVVVLIGIGGGFLALHNSKTASTNLQPKPTNTINYAPPGKQNKTEVDQHKQQLASNPSSSKDDASDPNQSAPVTLAVTITRVTNATSSQPLNVRALVSGTDSGTCTVSFAKSGQTGFSQNFAITFQATTASCDTINIPASSFPVSGAWNMSIVAKSGSATSAAAQRTVEVTQ